MKSCLVLAVALAGCATDFDPDVRVERQAATAATAAADGWTEGGAVLVGEPGTFVFPQPLSLRMSIVDSKDVVDGVKKQLTIASASVELVGSGTVEVVGTPSCQQNYCIAELRVLAAGASMLKVAGTGPDGTQRECIYYGIYEDADPAVGTVHRDELETQQSKCRATF
ncbi:MAG: hypothetical protein HOV81_24350 [Kofleriaceae bacterium]|nr:hypothetical protein [Kofleriaceae bacterium]